MQINIRVIDNLPNYSDIIRKFVDKAAQRIRARMRRKLNSESKHGRTYGWHTASAEGEAPASFTGALSASLQIESSLNESILFSALAEDYPRLLEEKMNRPLWQASIDEEIPFLENMLVDMMR